MKRRALLPTALLLLTCGCRFSGVPEPEPTEILLTKRGLVPEGEAPLLPYRLALAPIRVTFRPGEAFAKDPTKHASVPDLAEFRKEVQRALVATRMFSRVEPRGRTSSTKLQVQEQAWDQQDDLVLELELSSYHQEYMGHVNYLWWLLAYTWYVWPAWNVPIDEYGAGLKVRVRLRSVQQGGRPLLDEEYVVQPEQTKQEFTPSDRETVGFLDLGALWNVETSLKEANWKAIERGVGPHARQRFVLSLLSDLQERVVAPLAHGTGRVCEALQRSIRKRFALVIGVSKYADPKVGTAQHAADDARSVAAFWGTPEGGALVPGRDLTLLVDEAATRESILKGIAAVASHANPSDEVLVYLAGDGGCVPTGRSAPRRTAPNGALGGMAGLGAGPGPWEAVFLPQDAEADRLRETSLTLPQLGAALEQIPCERVVVFFDASFSGRRGASRTLGQRRRAARVRRRDLVRGLALPGRSLVFACGPRQGAFVLGEAKAGLFTQVLLRGMRGAADADSDAHVSLQEACDYARAEVASRAGLEGRVQVPLAVHPESVFVTWPR